MGYMNNQHLFKIVTCARHMQPRGNENKTEIRKRKQRHITEAYSLPGRRVEKGGALFSFCRGVWQWETMYLGWSHILSGPAGVRIKLLPQRGVPDVGTGTLSTPERCAPLTSPCDDGRVSFAAAVWKYSCLHMLMVLVPQCFSCRRTYDWVLEYNNICKSF